MAIDHKHVIQLIGEWGYSPDEFKHHIERQTPRSRALGDSVGGTMYASLTALAEYAMSGDAKKSVRVDTNKRLERMMRNDFGEEAYREIMESIKNPGFGEGVIDTIYETCDGCKSIAEVELKLRDVVMRNVASMVVSKMIDGGNDMCVSLMRCFIALDYAMISRDETDEEDNKLYNSLVERTKALDIVSAGIAGMSENLKKCRESCNPPFGEVIDMIIGEDSSIDEVFNSLKESMLSIIDSPPSRWTAYSAQYGKAISMLSFAMSLGYVEYDEYENFVNELNRVLSSVNFTDWSGDEEKESDDTDVTFGRN